MEEKPKEVVLRLSQIRKDYVSQEGHRFTGIKNVSLEIFKGDFVSIMGPSGSGKSTLANIIGLLAKPTDGQVSFLGKQCEKMSDRQITIIRNQVIGFIFQDYMLVEHMNILDNVRLSLHLHKFSDRKITKLSKEIIEQVGLLEHINKLPRQLSGGQKQRAAIARALVKRPQIVLADEPAGALDPKSRHDVLGLLQDLNQKGATIVMVTHNAEDARCGTRMIRIDQAQVVSDTPIEDRLSLNQLSA